jgi:hypothetical protein
MNIKQSFNVYYENRVAGIYVRVMYAQMDNGRYYKVYKKNDEITPELITLEEYASALAHVILDENNRGIF